MPHNALYVLDAILVLSTFKKSNQCYFNKEYADNALEKGTIVLPNILNFLNLGASLYQAEQADLPTTFFQWAGRKNKIFKF